MFDTTHDDQTYAASELRSDSNVTLDIQRNLTYRKKLPNLWCHIFFNLIGLLFHYADFGFDLYRLIHYYTMAHSSSPSIHGYDYNANMFMIFFYMSLTFTIFSMIFILMVSSANKKKWKNTLWCHKILTMVKTIFGSLINLDLIL